MTEYEYYAGEFTDAEIDKLADAGEFLCEEQGYFLPKPSQSELHKATEQGERLLTQRETSHYNQPTVKRWSVGRQPGGLWEIRLNGNLYIENGKAAIFRTEEEARRELCRIA